VLGTDTRFAVTVDPALDQDGITPSAQTERVDVGQIRDERYDERTNRAAPDDEDLPTGDGTARGRDGEPDPDERPQSQSRRADHAQQRGVVEPAKLNPNYIFDSFVIGSSNRL